MTLLKDQEEELINLKKSWKNFEGVLLMWIHKRDKRKSLSLLKTFWNNWLQRGRANWLMHGDRNTAFFHNAASARKRRNQIKKLLDENGVWVQRTEMKDHIKRYFANLFTSEVTQPNQDVLSLIPRKITEEMNNALLQYSVEKKIMLFSPRIRPRRFERPFLILVI